VLIPKKSCRLEFEIIWKFTYSTFARWKFDNTGVRLNFSNGFLSIFCWCEINYTCKWFMTFPNCKRQMRNWPSTQRQSHFSQKYIYLVPAAVKTKTINKNTMFSLEIKKLVCCYMNYYDNNLLWKGVEQFFFVLNAFPPANLFILCKKYEHICIYTLTKNKYSISYLKASVG